MALKDNLTRFLAAIRENPNYDIEEVKEMIMDTADDEIQTYSKQFTKLCHALTEVLIETKRSVSGINLLATAIKKIQNHRSQLTTIHSDFCLLCLDSKCLNPALPLLEIDYIEIKKTDDKDDDLKHVLLYYYYAGLIYAAIKNFEKASYF